MDGELRHDIQAFLTSLSDECKTCLHRRAAACDYCHAPAARRILRRMDTSPSADNPALRCDIVARMARIAAILQHARRPLLSVEIDMKDFCSRSLKEYTLREMVRIGKVVRRRVRGSDKYRYSLSNKCLRSLQVHSPQAIPQVHSPRTSPQSTHKSTVHAQVHKLYHRQGKELENETGDSLTFASRAGNRLLHPHFRLQE